MPAHSPKERSLRSSSLAPVLHEHAPAQRTLLVLHRSTGQPRDELTWAAQEMTALAHEVELDVVCTMLQTRSRGDSAAVLRGDTLATARALADPSSTLRKTSRGIDALLVDASLSAKQHRALTLELGIPVLDRTDLILRLFARRARTREAQLTVEIARLRHLLPRLRDDRSKLGREGGGGRAGRGNTQLALGKERTRSTLAALERELERVRQMAQVQRARRAEARMAVLVGYTNAGKSSWLSALSGTSTYVADKPFATLATTVRALRRKSQQPEPILLCDTVGFVRDLPHELVPSFRATLQEAADASLALYVVDASDPHFQAQLDVIEQTLHHTGALQVPHLLLLNKVDRLSQAERDRLAHQLPHALQVSALVSEDVGHVRRAIANYFELPE